MDDKELKEGMKAAEKDAGKEGGAGSNVWSPNIDWVLKSIGPFFNNNRGIGELLLDQLNENGVNTQSAALSAMVNVLQQFNKEYKELGEALGRNIDRIDELSSQSEDLAKAVEDLIKEMGGDTDKMPDIDLDEGSAEAPPPDMGGAMSPDMGAPPDMGGEMSPDMGATLDMGGAMSPDMGAPPAGGAGVPSDESVKNVKKYVISDEQLKNIASRLSSAYRSRRDARHNTRLRPNIISACARSDL